MESSSGTFWSSYKALIPIYKSMPDTEKTAVVGDKILHHMLNDNPSFRYDMMPGAFVLTSTSLLKKDLIRLGDALGPRMESVPKDIEKLILSFGLDDLLQHSGIEWQKNQVSQTTPDMIIEANKSLIENLAKKLVVTVEAIGRSFPNAEVLYIIPTPSESEACVVDHFRREILVAWQSGEHTAADGSKLAYLDPADCLKPLKNIELVVKGPGSLTWTAGVLLSKEIYTRVFPDMAPKFGDCCSSIHIEGMCNKDSYSHSVTDFGGTNFCRLCNSQDHATKKCTARSFFRDEQINCGHCGSLASNLSHHPDFCYDRFSNCTFCDLVGHNVAVHANAVSLKIAVNRLGPYGIPYKRIGVVKPKEDPSSSQPPAKRAKYSEDRFSKDL